MARVIGIARREETARLAESEGSVDWGTTDLDAGIAEADIIVLATPVRTILHQLDYLSMAAKRHCLVMDMGSTKLDIVQAMNDLPDHLDVLGTHPMCGKEKRGLEVADGDLYEGAPWVLVPLSRTSPNSLSLVQQLAAGVGASPLFMDAARHDRLVAAISHLPYALAVSLMLAVTDVGEDDPMMWQLAAGGFRDTSRVAESDVTMMMDILLTNREVVGELLERAAGNLHQMASYLANGDEVSLRTRLETAQKLRSGHEIPPSGCTRD